MSTPEEEKRKMDLAFVELMEASRKRMHEIMDQIDDKGDAITGWRDPKYNSSNSAVLREAASMVDSDSRKSAINAACAAMMTWYVVQEEEKNDTTRGT